MTTPSNPDTIAKMLEAVEEATKREASDREEAKRRHRKSHVNYHIVREYAYDTLLTRLRSIANEGAGNGK